ncbi:MAG TPA: hypothetical protein VIG69_13735 [Candidatus Methylomirabilis sp.]
MRPWHVLPTPGADSGVAALYGWPGHPHPPRHAVRPWDGAMRADNFLIMGR